MTTATSSSFLSRDEAPDATLVGTHCEDPHCTQLDFLPFLCQSCSHTFCLDHRTETAHKCPNPGSWARQRAALLAASATPAIGSDRPLINTVKEKKACDKPECKEVIGTGRKEGVYCDGCGRDYCLGHRMPEEHGCKELEALTVRAAFRKRQAELTGRKQEILTKFWNWAGQKKEAAGRALPKARPSTAAQRVVAVNQMKKTAKGDQKILAEKRIYLMVEAEAATTKSRIPKGAFFFNKEWVVGRVLDAAARQMQVENVNNQSIEEVDKLRVFHVEGGRVLEFSEKIETVCVSGNTIVLLRGVGAPVDLIET